MDEVQQQRIRIDAELARHNKTSVKQKLKRALVLAASVVMSSAAFSNPSLNSVTSGNVVVTQTSNSTTVQQSSQQAIIEWNSFNIGANEKTQFIQPNSNSVALNRINPNQGASQILGSLSANGKIFLVNQAGIFFGPGAHVDVGGLIASTSDISNANFTAGKYIFDQPSQFGGSIINEGAIRAASYGLIALIGSNITNNGLIEAKMGSIVLASGSKFTISFDSSQLINFSVDAPASSGKIVNNGALIANGGTILVTAQTAKNVLDNVIDMNGVAMANSVSQKNGEIILSAGDNGTVEVSGKLLANGRGAGSTGGTIKILGNTVHLASTAVVDALGDAGGGTIIVGGDLHGAGPDFNATTTTLDAGSMINASALRSGNGGDVDVWANSTTTFLGSIIAEAGINSGNGGYTEVSGHELLNFAGSVDLLAPHGNTGTLLLDPEDLVIEEGGSSTVTQYGSTFTSNFDTSILTVADLELALSSASVLLVTGSGALQAGDITVLNDVLWSNSNTLTMSAFHSINIDANITNNAGGSLVLQADNTGTGLGTIAFNNGGMINMSGGGTLSMYYNPVVFGTQDAAIANSSNSPNPANINIDPSTTFNPYMIVTTLDELQSINNNLSGDYALGTNIDASSTISWNGGAGFVSLGGEGSGDFSGNFDGQNHVISNLFSTINGLFGEISYYSVVQNVGVTNAIVNVANAGAGSFGLLVGINFGTIINSNSSGSLSNHDNLGSDDLGGLVGTNYGTISSSTTNTNVSSVDSGLGYESIGGFIGNNVGTINGSSSYGNVSSEDTSGSETVGGFAGNNEGYLNNSFSTGNVSNLDHGIGYEVVGGLLGTNFSGTVFGSYSIGNVLNTISANGGTSVGGLVGNNLGSIESAYSSGNVVNDDSAGNDFVGGFAGSNNGTISDSYSIGNVTNNDNGGLEAVGGFAGYNFNAYIFNAYSSGLVTNNDPNPANEVVAGFVGYNYGTISASFWDLVTSGQSNGYVTNNGQALVYGGCFGTCSATVGNAVNTTPVDLSQLSTYTDYLTANNDTPWNLGTGSSTTPNDATWFIFSGATRPILISEEFVNNVALPIQSAHQLQLMAADLSANYVLGNNVDFGDALSNPRDIWGGSAGLGFAAIGDSNNEFTGSFNGNNFTINHYSSSQGGLFGETSSNAVIENVGMINAVVNLNNMGSGSFGLLVNNNFGSISNANVSGTLTNTDNAGSEFLGGLVGANYGSISNSYSLVSVTNSDSGFGSEFIGGLAGFSNGNISNSYSSTGSVTSSDNFGFEFIGGLLGFNSGTLFNVFNTNSVTNNDVAFGSEFVGGLVGLNSNGNISNSYSTGSVSNTIGGSGSAFVGGFVGQNQGNIMTSYSTSPVSNSDVLGSDYVGGFVGNNVGSISSSYSNGHVSNNDNGGNEVVGGFAGYNFGATISQSYSSSILTNNDSNPAETLGGFVGNNSGSILASFFDAGLAGHSGYGVNTGSVALYGGCFGTCSFVINNASNSAPLDLTQVSTYTSYLSSQGQTPWNILSSSSSTPSSYDWFIVPGSLRPILIFEEFANNTPLTIYSAHQLELMNADLGANYVLGGNINLASSLSNPSDAWGGSSTAGFVPIGNINAPFTGVLNGSNYSISGLTVYLPNSTDVGLFGANSGYIQNLNVVNSNITGAANVGGLVGINLGSLYNDISSANVSAIVSGASDLGGLVGDNSGVIRHSYGSGTIILSGNNDSNIGGLVGAQESTGAIVDLSASEAFNITGSGTAVLGGIIGYNAGTIYGSTISLSNTSLIANASIVGGVVGENSGAVLDGLINATENVSGTNIVGGIVGENINGGTVSNSSSSTTVSGVSNVGGIAGLNAGTLLNDMNAGTLLVGSNESNIGGVVGSNSGVVSGSAFTGTIQLLGSNSTHIDGLIGNNTSSSSSSSPQDATIVDTAGNNTWLITGLNSGNVAGNYFSNLINLTGGNGDTFKLSDGAGVSGTISASAGTLDYSAYSTAIFVNLSASTSTNVGSFSGITTFVGTGITSSASYNPNATVWVLSAPNKSLVSGTTFVNFGNLTGGSGDTFDLGNGAGVSGSITAINSTLNYSQYTTAVNVNLANNTASNVGSFSGITTIIGDNNAASVISGPTSPANWAITSNNSGNVAGTAFSSFANVTANGSGDIFTLSNGAGISGKLTATSGTLNYSAYSTPVAVNLSTNSATNIGGGFAGITNFIGGSAGGSMTNSASGQTWVVSGTNSGNVGSDSFSSFSNLVGGANAAFILSNGAAVTGSLSATSNGSLNYSAFTSPVSVNLATSSATNVPSFSGISNFVGNGASSSLADSNNSVNWAITGSNAGSVAGNNFSNFANISGGNGSSFNLSNGAGITGALSATNGSLNYSAYTTAVAVNLLSQSATNIGGGYTGITNFVGGSGSNSISDSAGGNTWSITANNAGNVAGSSFSSFANIAGGAGDIFKLSNGAGISGTVSATNGTLNYNAYTTAVAVNLSTNSATNIGSYSGITNFAGSTTAGGTLTNSASSQTWLVTGSNTGSVGSNNFSSFNKLVGGASADFVLSNGASVTGSLSATSAGTLDYSAYAAPVSVNLAASSGTNVASFSGISNFVGNGANGTVADANASTSWSITGTNAGSVAGNNFSNFANISGGSASTFNLSNGAGITGTLSATNGSLNYSAYTTPVAVNLVAKSATNIGGGYTGITSFVGGSGSNSLSDTAGGSTWAITSNNAGTIAGNSFSGFANITGGSADNFVLSNGAGISGALAATNSTLNYSAYTAPVAVSISSHTASNIGGGYSGITSFVGGSGSNSMSDTAGGNTWAITANNAGNVAGTSFTSFANIAGGSSDIFNLSNGVGVSGTLSATNGTLSYSAYTTPIAVNLASSSATNIGGGFSGMSNFVGNNNTTSSLTGANVVNTWNITGANSGNINSTTTYSGFPNLVGGTNYNTYKFVSGGSEANINGGPAPIDTLDFSALSTTVNVVLTGVGTQHGFAGTTSAGLSAGFNNIDTIIDSTSSANQLTGTNLASTWTVTGVNSGNMVAGGNTLNFTNFPNIVAGTGSNTVSYSPGGSLTGSFTNPGNNNLIYNAPITFTANLTLTSTGTGNIIINGGVNWTGSYTLTVKSANDIIINSPVVGLNGSLVLSAINAPQSITTGATGSINVANLTIAQGQWYQVGTLPALNVSNNFTIAPGAQFIRASGGSGTSTSPFILTDIYGVQGVGSSAATLKYSYLVGNNISGTVTSNWNNGAGFVPIGTSATPFVGSINGQNFTISNVYVNHTADANELVPVGLFGYTNGATVSNLTVSGNFIGETYVGALIGVANNTTLTNTHVGSSTVVTLFNDGDQDAVNESVGGLVGYNTNGAITNSSNAGSVIDQMWDSNIGGLIGYNVNGTVSGSSNSGTVYSGNDNTTWGSFGNWWRGCIRNTVALAYNNNIGGLIGYNTGTVMSSSNSGSISSQAGSFWNVMGGLIGVNTGAVSSSSSSGSVVAGSGTTASITAGLIGYNAGSIANSSNSGAVSTTYNGSFNYLAGLVGANTGSITNSNNTGSVSNTAGGQAISFGCFQYFNNHGFGNFFNLGGWGLASNSSNEIAGVVAVNSGSITSSHNTGAISVASGSSLSAIAGLVAYATQSSQIYTSNNSGAITVGSNSIYDTVAGLVAINYGLVSSSSDTGSVNGGSNASQLVISSTIGANYGTSTKNTASGSVTK